MSRKLVNPSNPARQDARVDTLVEDFVTEDESDVYLDAHRAETDPHPDFIDDLDETTTPAEADYAIISVGGVNKRVSLQNMADAIFGDDWTDLVLEATGINPPGAASDPARNQTTGLLEFSATADNVITGCWQLPHGWSGAFHAEVENVRPHLHTRHLTSTSAPNNVSRWKFEYDVASPNGDFLNPYGTFTTLDTFSVTNPARTLKSSLCPLGTLPLTGYKGSTLIHFRISRLANSDAADTDTSVIALYSLDLHLRIRRAGSENEIPDGV
jgi:hypothetical protein